MTKQIVGYGYVTFNHILNTRRWREAHGSVWLLAALDEGKGARFHICFRLVVGRPCKTYPGTAQRTTVLWEREPSGTSCIPVCTESTSVNRHRTAVGGAHVQQSWLTAMSMEVTARTTKFTMTGACSDAPENSWGQHPSTARASLSLQLIVEAC